MGSSPVTTGTTAAQSQSQPWGPAVPAVTSLLGNLSGIPTSLSPSQSSAMQALLGTSTGPNFAPAAANTASNLLSGGNAGAEAPAYSSALTGLQSTLNPIANASLNPMNTPGFGAALTSMNNGITNQVNDQFAAAGRDLSPGNTTALGYGIAQGDAPAIANQYNSNVTNASNAANALYGAGNTTAGALTGLNQTGLGNQLTGASLAGSIPGLAQAPAAASLNAANTAQNLPFSNLSSLESLLTPLAQLGTQSTGTGTTTSQTQIPLWQQILGGATGGAGVLASLFGAPAGGTSAAANLYGLIPNAPNSSSNPGTFGWG